VRNRLLLTALALLAVAAPAHAAGGPQPGTPEYVQRDNQNIADAYGRQTQQQSTPQYTQALAAEHTENGFDQIAATLAQPNRPAITPGNVFPGWNGGNPLRRGWDGRRGQIVPVEYTNRYGALIRGHVFAPLPGAKDPYTGARLEPPYPGVVITTGSVQGSERMYFWLAEDLAERGYVVLTYDVQGQGMSETLPHENDQVSALPFCNPFAPPGDGEQFGCPGVPAQQDSNFVFGTEDALTFFLSTPDQAPDPRREEETRFDAWRKAGVDTMVVVPRASTHLEYTDIAYALPASRYGQDFASVYVQRWLDRYLKHEGALPAAPAKHRHHRAKPKHRRHHRRAKHHRRARARAAGAYTDPLLASSFTYLEPVDVGRWAPVTLDRAKQLSFYFCSGYAFRDPRTHQMKTETNLGC